MPRQRRRTTVRRSRRRRPTQRGGLVLGRRNQKGGIFPLLALALPALIAVGKAAALGGVGAAAGYGIKKALTATERRKTRGRY